MYSAGRGSDVVATTKSSRGNNRAAKTNVRVTMYTVDMLANLAREFIAAYGDADALAFRVLTLDHYK